MLGGSVNQSGAAGSSFDMADALKMINTLTGSDTKDFSRNEMATALNSLLPQLLSGALVQSTDEKTKQGFEKALDDHSKDEAAGLAGFLKSVDISDGSKIVNHLLGTKKEAVVQETAKKSGLDVSQVAKIAAIAAPLIMSTLGKTNKSVKEATEGASSTSSLISKFASNPRLISALAGAVLGTGSKKSTGSLASILVSSLLK